jgi:hypothetical protein
LNMQRKLLSLLLVLRLGTHTCLDRNVLLCLVYSFHSGCSYKRQLPDSNWHCFHLYHKKFNKKLSIKISNSFCRYVFRSILNKWKLCWSYYVAMILGGLWCALARPCTAVLRFRVFMLPDAL